MSTDPSHATPADAVAQGLPSSEPGAPVPTRQPRGLRTLFLTEMWERFSFYGMKAQLVLYLIAAVEAGGRGWTKEQAGTLMGYYAGLVYLAPLLGGYLADRILGTSRCLIIGGCIIASGHFVLLLDSLPTLFAGLGLVILGTGFFKSNVSTMVGQLYKQGDARRDAGFTIFYMGINLGAFLAPLTCGWLQVYYGAKLGAGLGWRIGFAAAGVGMVFGLVQYLIGRNRHLAGIGEAPVRRRAGDAPVVTTPLTREERHRVALLFIMVFFVLVFFAAYEQGGTAFAFFADGRTDRALPPSLAWIVGGTADTGAQFPAGWFQSVNPLLILLLAPLFATMWVRLARRGREPGTLVKMGLGLIILGGGFVFMVLAGHFSDGGLKVAPLWLVATYFVHTCAELCLSPVGLSLVTKLAPLKFASLLMGVWFLPNFGGGLIAGLLASQYDKFAASKGLVLGGLADFFLLLALLPTVVGVVLLAASPVLKRLMHGRG